MVTRGDRGSRENNIYSAAAGWTVGWRVARVICDFALLELIVCGRAADGKGHASLAARGLYEAAERVAAHAFVRLLHLIGVPPLAVHVAGGRNLLVDGRIVLDLNLPPNVLGEAVVQLGGLEAVAGGGGCSCGGGGGGGGGHFVGFDGFGLCRRLLIVPIGQNQSDLPNLKCFLLLLV